MKKLFLLSGLLAFGLYSCGQEPPSEVRIAFEKQYSKTENLKWDNEEPNVWEAEFVLSGKEMSSSYSASGQWIETETETDIKDLPAELFKIVHLNFKGFEIEEASGIEKPDYKGFEIILEKEKTVVEILANEKGESTIISVTVGDDEDHDGEKNEGDEEKNEQD